jgi:undecaprenyl-phosphate 4-deoxy-4-formamido-L-arabinose transferase
MTKESHMLRISILIPVFNAGNTIEVLCRSLITLYSRKYELQIVLVNDGSRDNSDAACKKLYAGNPSVITYIRMSKNFGEHNALMAGLRHVSGDYCVMMDDDLQNPPEEVEKLITEIQKGHDAVYTYYASKKDSFFRNLGSRFNDRIASIILKKPSGLYLSSFKIINRFLVRELAKYNGPDPYIDGMILRTTDSIGKVEAIHRKRADGRSGYTLGKLVSLWGNMVISFSLVPLRLIGIAGLLLTVAGLIYGAHKAYDDYYTYGKLTDFETLISLNVFFRGLALLAISVLGEYVGRIYLSLKSDPQFVIREIFTPGNTARKIDYIKGGYERDHR